jgi:Uma2 family endonuclease
MEVKPSFTSYSEPTDAYAVAYQNEREKPMPSKLHSRVQGNIYFELRTKYGSKFDPFQELSFDLSHGKPVPDVCLLEKKSIDFLRDEIKVKENPLLVIEILSPRQSVDDIREKIANIYFPSGVKSAWIVFPTLKIVSVALPNGEYKTITEGAVKDLNLDVTIDLKDIFK